MTKRNSSDWDHATNGNHLNMLFDGWIQSTDYSIQEFSAMDRHAASRLFSEYDWGRERERQDELLVNNYDCCPTGFGLEHPEGHRLWIRPNLLENKCWVTFTIKSQPKFFGLIPVPDVEIESEDVQFPQVSCLIAEFYQQAPDSSVRLKLIGSSNQAPVTRLQ